jgi:hypothetical protein
MENTRTMAVNWQEVGAAVALALGLGTGAGTVIERWRAGKQTARQEQDQVALAADALQLTALRETNELVQRMYDRQQTSDAQREKNQVVLEQQGLRIVDLTVALAHCEARHDTLEAEVRVLRESSADMQTTLITQQALLINLRDLLTMHGVPLPESLGGNRDAVSNP